MLGTQRAGLDSLSQGPPSLPLRVGGLRELPEVAFKPGYHQRVGRAIEEHATELFAGAQNLTPAWIAPALVGGREDVRADRTLDLASPRFPIAPRS